MDHSQNGFPASPHQAEIGVRPHTVPGTAVHLPIRGDIAPLLLTMAKWFQDNVEALRPGECHGFAFRKIAGSNTLSNHSSGTAIDLNAPSHPVGVRGTVPDGLRGAISARAGELGLRWGGDFAGRVDEMHFEVNVPHDRALEIVRRLGNGHPALAIPPTVRRGSRGETVHRLQAILNRDHAAFANLVVDGIFGPRTEAVVKEFQRRAGLEVDGIVGPRTWARLLGA